MASYTLAADSTIESFSPAAGDKFDLNGHTLTVSSNLSTIGVSFFGSIGGKIILKSGAWLKMNGDSSAPRYPGAGTVIQAGEENNPLPARGDFATPYPLNAAAVLESTFGNNQIFASIKTFVDSPPRPQFARVVSSDATSIVIDRDMQLSAGDVIAFHPQTAQANNPNWPILTVTEYTSNGSVHTIKTSSRSFNPGAGAQCVLLTCGFCVQCYTITSPMGPIMGRIMGDEIGFYHPHYFQSVPVIGGDVDVFRLVCAQNQYQSFFYGFGNSARIKCGKYVSNSVMAWAREGDGNFGSAFSADIGEAYCPSLHAGYNNREYRPINGRGIIVRGGDVSVWPCPPLGRAEYVDTTLPGTLYSALGPSSELVIRTTSPETCVIHRAAGIATLVKRGGGDAVMADAPVAEAYQLAPTGTDAVWHDQAVTVEAGARLTVAWRSFCSIGAIGGVQIIADSPLFGQVAVPMGTADVLAEYTESTPPLGVWGPSSLLSWRNTSGQPARVWVRGWGQGGIVYSNAQVVKGGQL